MVGDFYSMLYNYETAFLHSSHRITKIGRIVVAVRIIQHSPENNSRIRMGTESHSCRSILCRDSGHEEAFGCKLKSNADAVECEGSINNSSLWKKYRNSN